MENLLNQETDNNNKLFNHFTGLGFVIGVGIGSALGTSLSVAFDFPMRTGIGTSAGAILGIGIGAVLHQASQKK